MFDQSNQELLLNSIIHEVSMAKNSFDGYLRELARPSTVHKAELEFNGEEWCAFYQANNFKSVRGFGKTPEAAMADFDRIWLYGKGQS